ncbi:hypothetical protein [Nocardia sp. CA-120079]|uniref:hypothetical protein n=1 Tax=Nocardia sp. CA-120079 TaxID=3239974 RepID=UPI003D9774DF
MTMPRRRESHGPKRHRREADAIGKLFVEIDKDLVERAQKTAECQNVNLWEVVESALRKGLPSLPVKQGQQTLIEVPQQDRYAS